MKKPRFLQVAELCNITDNLAETIETADLDEEQGNYLIESLIPRDGVTVLGGAPKTGKTTLVMNMIYSIVTNQNFLGKRIIQTENDKIKPLFMTNEESNRVCFSRLQKIFGDDEGIEKVEIATRIKYGYTNGLLDIIEAEAEMGYNLFIVDNFRSFGVDKGIEKDFSGEQLAERLRWMTDMCEELHISIILIHHTRKRGNNKIVNQSDELAGGGAIGSVADSIIMLSRTGSEKIKMTASSRVAKDQNFLLTLNSDPLRFQFEDLHQAEHDAEKQEYLKTGIHAVFQKIFETDSVFECRMADLIKIAEENGIQLYVGNQNSPSNTKSRSVAVQLNRFREQIYSVDNVTYTSRRSNGQTIYKFVLERKEAEDDETIEKIAS